ncbi:MAG: LysR substrate-binding domain-containing protein [Sutterella sp.]|nr:LysR substrate-binding domain-containing protein [Sutterella sp.]
MFLNTQTLLVIVTLAECKTFTSAAERLNRVPTALSYTLNKAESDLGVKLFHRRGKALELTEAGYYFVKNSLSILSQLYDLQHSTQRLASGVEPLIRITLNNIINPQALFELIRESLRHFPQTQIALTTDVHDGVWDALMDKRADIAVGAPNQLGLFDDIVSEEMGIATWVFAISPAHPLAKIQHPLSQEDLRAYPAITIPDTSRKLPPKVAWLLRGQQELIAPDFHTKIKMHVAGLGIGFLPRYFAQPYIDDGRLVALPVEITKIPTPLHLAWATHPPQPCRTWWLKQLRDQALWAQLMSPLAES